MMRPCLIKLTPFLIALLVSANAFGQISSDCEGVVVPDDYNEASQQAFLQNYFSAAFAMTALHAPLPFIRRSSKASIALEAAWVPPLNCQRRLVVGGTKTEETNRTPIFPRPRLTVALPSLGPIDSYIEVVALPPIKTPLGRVMQMGGEFGLGRAFDFGLSIGARTHLSIIHARSEIAGPFNEGDTIYDDLLIASSLGAEIGIGYTHKNLDWITPYATAGIGDVSTMFIVGDNLSIVQNTTEPWSGLTASLGAQMFFWDHLLVVFEGSTAFPVLTTVKAKVGYAW